MAPASDGVMGAWQTLAFPSPWQVYQNMHVIMQQFIYNKPMKLGKNFFNQPAIELAKALLGTHLVFGKLRGMIVETEAYLYRDDPASHAAPGLTKRNAPMFGPAGYSYVYLIYGMYHCFNIVSGKTGEGEAVLIRALQPIDGIDLMQKRRNTTKIENLCSGPGKLTQAFGITKEHNNLDLSESKEIQIHSNPAANFKIQNSKRIGLSVGQDLELRFFIENNSFVSKSR